MEGDRDRERSASMRAEDGVDGVEVDGGARPFGRSNQYTNLQGGSDGTGYNTCIDISRVVHTGKIT